MLQLKDIKNLSELTSSFCERHGKSDFFRKFIRILGLGSFSSIFSSVKRNGISPRALIEVLISSDFAGQRNVHGLVGSCWGELVGYGKDAYYRLKSNPRIDWRRLLIKVALRAMSKVTVDDLGEGDGPKTLIFDDTQLEKTGRGIEGVSKVWDHVCSRSILGFRLLVMGFYNGSVFIPIDFSLHREAGKNKKKPFGLNAKDRRSQYRKERVKDSPGYQRKKELDQSKMSIAVRMIRSAMAEAMDVQYVLTDSWFTCWEMVSTAKEAGLDYIGMFSKVKTLFQYQGKNMNYMDIRKAERKSAKRNKRFKLYYIRKVVLWKGIPVVLYFTRKGKNGKWKVLLNTDTSSSFTSIVETYQLRWSIEVFFRDCKQLLGLGKEQSTDLDAQSAHTTLTLIQHIFLSLKNQVENYKSLGGMFRGSRAETLEIRLHQRLIALLIAIVDLIQGLFEGADFHDAMEKLVRDP